MRDGTLGWAIESENDGTQSGAEPAEFVFVGVGKFVEYFEAVHGESDVHLATVFCTGCAADQILCRQTIDQSNGTVVRDLQLFGKFSDSHRISTRKALNREKCLVLARS